VKLILDTIFLEHNAVIVIITSSLMELIVVQLVLILLQDVLPVLLLMLEPHNAKTVILMEDFNVLLPLFVVIPTMMNILMEIAVV
jgi:hypothetical protein